MSPVERSGSGQVKTGTKTQSENEPVAWFVLEPSKPQISGFLPSAMMRVFERKPCVGSAPSIQMYSAWYGMFSPRRQGTGVPQNHSFVRTVSATRLLLNVCETCHEVGVSVAGRLARWPLSVSPSPK